MVSQTKSTKSPLDWTNPLKVAIREHLKKDNLSTYHEFQTATGMRSVAKKLFLSVREDMIDWGLIPRAPIVLKEEPPKVVVANGNHAPREMRKVDFEPKRLGNTTADGDKVRANLFTLGGYKEIAELTLIEYTEKFGDVKDANLYSIRKAILKNFKERDPELYNTIFGPPKKEAAAVPEPAPAPEPIKLVDLRISEPVFVIPISGPTDQNLDDSIQNCVEGVLRELAKMEALTGAFKVHVLTSPHRLQVLRERTIQMVPSAASAGGAQ